LGIRIVIVPALDDKPLCPEGHDVPPAIVEFLGGGQLGDTANLPTGITASDLAAALDHHHAESAVRTDILHELAVARLEHV